MINLKNNNQIIKTIPFVIYTIWNIVLMIISIKNIIDFIEMIHVDEVRIKIYQSLINFLILVGIYIIVSVLYIWKNEKKF